MPHISKRKIDTKTRRKLEEHLVSILLDTDFNTREKIFRELFTETEKLMLAKRIAIILGLEINLSTYAISEKIKVSPSTVARFENKIQLGKYPHLIKWLKKYSGKRRKVLDMILELAALPFEIAYKSKTSYKKRF